MSLGWRLVCPQYQVIAVLARYYRCPRYRSTLQIELSSQHASISEQTEKSLVLNFRQTDNTHASRQEGRLYNAQQLTSAFYAINFTAV